MERREFLAGAAAAVTALAAKELTFPTAASAQAAPAQTLVTQLWSRHLQWVGTQAQQVADPFGTGVKVGDSTMSAESVSRATRSARRWRRCSIASG